MNHYKCYQCKANDAGRRLDRVLKKLLADVPAGLIYSSLRKGRIKVNGKKRPQSCTVSENDIIEIHDSIYSANAESPRGGTGYEFSPAAVSRLAEITVLETPDLLFVNKPRGMLTHGKDSLASLILNARAESGGSLSFKPAPLHRLDRNTSGLVTAGLSIEGARTFSKLVRERRIIKHYIGLCYGGPDEPVRLEHRISRSGMKTELAAAGKPDGSAGTDTAITEARPLIAESGGFVLTHFIIETGKTHQIRFQTAAAGFPLAGDAKYGGKIPGTGFYILHAFALTQSGPVNPPLFAPVFAGLPDGSFKTLAELFGSSELKNAIGELKRKIIS